MKKYLGSPIDAYGAVVVLVAICFPLAFAAIILDSGVDFARVVLLAGCALCSVIWCVFLKMVAIQLYAWGCFEKESVHVRALFTKPFSIDYAKCFGCGIGYYIHGVLNSRWGSKVYYIFLSYDKFDEQYRERMNLWKPTTTQIKVNFSPQLFNFLIEVLPKNQSKMLSQDYKKFFE